MRDAAQPMLKGILRRRRRLRRQACGIPPAFHNQENRSTDDREVTRASGVTFVLSLMRLSMSAIAAW